MGLKAKVDGQAREIRARASGLEVRADDGAGIVRVEGYAAIFGAEAVIGEWWREVIEPGAFSASLAEGRDVQLLIGHEGLPLARRSSGTLEIVEDARGLKIAADLDASDPDVMRITPKLRRGDLSGMSFGFRVRPSGAVWVEGEALPLRRLAAVDLFEVSIVADPAYDAASIALRGLDLSGVEARGARAVADARAWMHARARLSGVAV